MTTLAWVAVAFVVALTAFWITAIVCVWRAARAVRRSRTIQRAALHVQALGYTGTRRRAVILRLRLADALERVDRDVAFADARLARQPETARLLRRIRAVASSLDNRLQLFAVERDESAFARDLPLMTHAVDEVQDMARQLCAALRNARDSTADAELRDLASEVRREVTALHAGTRTLQELNSEETW